VTSGQTTVASYQYDDNGNITRQDNANGTYALYTVDSRNRITNLSHKYSNGTMFLGLSYLYDDVGNRTREKESNSTYRDFFYDDNGQLTRETKRTIAGDEDPYGQGNRMRLCRADSGPERTK
jgi:YD repeat-containing protein